MCTGTPQIDEFRDSYFQKITKNKKNIIKTLYLDVKKRSARSNQKLTREDLGSQSCARVASSSASAAAPVFGSQTPAWTSTEVGTGSILVKLSYFSKMQKCLQNDTKRSNKTAPRGGYQTVGVATSKLFVRRRRPDSLSACPPSAPAASAGRG